MTAVWICRACLHVVPDAGQGFESIRCPACTACTWLLLAEAEYLSSRQRHHMVAVAKAASFMRKMKRVMEVQSQ